MFGIRSDLLLYGVGAAVALIVLNRLMSGRIATAAFSTVAALPVDAVIGASETLFSLPDPRTAESKTACQLAQEAGDDWEASFQCPAAKWFGGLFDGK